MNKDLDIARKAAREGVRIIKEFKKDGFIVKKKGFHDLITDADIAAEEAILSVIKRLFPTTISWQKSLQATARSPITEPGLLTP